MPAGIFMHPVVRQCFGKYSTRFWKIISIIVHFISMKQLKSLLARHILKWLWKIGGGICRKSTDGGGLESSPTGRRQVEASRLLSTEHALRLPTSQCQDTSQWGRALRITSEMHRWRRIVRYCPSTVTFSHFRWEKYFAWDSLGVKQTSGSHVLILLLWNVICY